MQSFPYTCHSLHPGPKYFFSYALSVFDIRHLEDRASWYFPSHTMESQMKTLKVR